MILREKRTSYQIKEDQLLERKKYIKRENDDQL